MGYRKLRKSEYAKEMGVHKSRISKLNNDGLLKTVRHMGMEMVVACPSNAKLFEKPYPTRGKKRLKKGEKLEDENK